MYYVEARVPFPSGVVRFTMLPDWASVIAWVRKNVTEDMVLRVFVPSTATASELKTIKSLGARVLR